MNVVDRTDIFIIYSHQDERWRSELEPYLTRNMRQSAVKTWSTDQIRSDSKWCPDIQSVLDHSKVVVMLVTPVFLDSAFIDEHGLEPLLEGAEKSGISIRWILVRACAWNGTPLQDYRPVVSPPEIPLAQMRAERASAWERFFHVIKSIVENGPSRFIVGDGREKKQRDGFQPWISLNAAVNHLRSQGCNMRYLNRLRCTLSSATVPPPYKLLPILPHISHYKPRIS